MEKKGLPYLTIIERLMDGDEEIKKLFDFEDFDFDTKHIELSSFNFKAEKTPKPDIISFDFGVQWEYPQLRWSKFNDKEWENDIVEYGSVVHISPLYYHFHPSNIKFTYQQGGGFSLMNKLQMMCYGDVKKIDIADDILITREDGTECNFYNAFVKSAEIDEANDKEIYEFVCDWFQYV